MEPNVPNVLDPTITKSELLHAIMEQRNEKVTGLLGVSTDVDLLKIIGEVDSEQLTLTALFNKVYKSAENPTDWLKSTFVALLKKAKQKHVTNIV